MNGLWFVRHGFWPLALLWLPIGVAAHMAFGTIASPPNHCGRPVLAVGDGRELRPIDEAGR